VAGCCPVRPAVGTLKVASVLPSFWMMRAYFLAARRDSCSLLAPVHTILPEAKMSAVVLGSLMRMITAAKRCMQGHTQGREPPCGR
jgi:hypothetical protein